MIHPTQLKFIKHKINLFCSDDDDDDGILSKYIYNIICFIFNYSLHILFKKMLFRI